MQRLPETIFEAKRQAAPRAILRLVPYGEAVDALPTDADAFVGRGTSPRGMVLKPLLLLAVSAGFVWLVTVNAWDDEGFFPWFWNPLWVLFPWVFLAPLWVAFFRSLARKPAADALRRNYDSWRAAAVATTGTVTDTRIARTDSGAIADYVAAISSAGGDLVLGRTAPGTIFVPHEAPRPGDTVRLWRLPHDWVLVQAPRHPAQAAVADTAERQTIADHLKQLADLHRSGELTEQEFEQAKQRLLD